MFKELDEITFCIKTWERPHKIRESVSSIKRFYPEAKIIVADDSETPTEIEGLYKFLRLPYDTGLSQGRNELVQATDTPYLVIMDDDLLFMEDTKIEIFHQILSTHEELDFITGRVRQHGLQVEQEQIPTVIWGRDTGDTLYEYHNQVHRKFDDYVTCDFAPNFYLARTDRLLKFPYPPFFKVMEHVVFFYLYLDQIKFGYTPKVVANHNRYPLTEKFQKIDCRRRFYNLMERAFFEELGFKRRVFVEEGGEEVEVALTTTPFIRNTFRKKVKESDPVFIKEGMRLWGSC